MENKIFRMGELTLDDTLYPRLKISDDVVKKYSESMHSGAKFPPILVGRYGKKNIVVDGWHRVYASKRNKIPFIAADVVIFYDRVELFKEAVKRNITHGQSLIDIDRIRSALRLEAMGVGVVEISKIVCIRKKELLKRMKIKDLKIKPPVTEKQSDPNQEFTKENKFFPTTAVEKNNFIQLRFKSFLKSLHGISNHPNLKLTKENESILIEIKDAINQLIMLKENIGE